MINILTRARRGPIGMDIGSDGVRLLQLARNGNKLAVVAAGRWSYPAPSQGTGDDAARRRLLVGAVRDLLKNRGFRGRDAVSCIRADQLCVKNVRLPHMSDAELAGAVQWEGQERFGFEVGPDRLFFVNAGEVRQGNEVKDEIILMAVREDTIASHLQLLHDVGLRPRHVDSEPTALFRSYDRFLRRAEDESIVSVVVDLGLTWTKVVIARGHTILFIKSIDIGGTRFNECIAKELGLSPAEAAHLRRRERDTVAAADSDASASPGEAPGEDAGRGASSSNVEPAGKTSSDQVEWSILDAMREQVQNLAREISLCLRYCSVTFRGLRPSKVTLAGGEAYDRGLVRLLGENLDCPCAVGEPLRGVETGSVDLGMDRRGELTEWSVAMGLALRGQPESAPVRNYNERSRISA